MRQDSEWPLVEYLRYNVQPDSDWLYKSINKSMTDDEVKKLQAMDRPENMPALSELGIQAAQRQIQDRHFPRGFDLGE